MAFRANALLARLDCHRMTAPVIDDPIFKTRVIPRVPMKRGGNPRTLVRSLFISPRTASLSTRATPSLLTAAGASPEAPADSSPRRNDMHELIIRDAKIVDGSGVPAFNGDLAIDKGVITAVGRVTNRGHREIASEWAAGHAGLG